LANIKENKDTNTKEEDDKKKGFGFEEEKKDETSAGKEKQAKKFGDGPMTFSRPPKFNSKKPGKFGDGDFDSLDNLDKPGDSKSKNAPTNDSGQKEFIHLGAQSKSEYKDGVPNLLKEKSHVDGEKPKKFSGRMNLSKTGSQAHEENSEGVTKDYSFGVVYKTPAADGEKQGPREPRDRKFGDDKPYEERKGGYKGKRDKGTAFGAK